MMRFMGHKTVAKILSIIISIMFLGGIGMMAYTQMSDANTKDAVANSNIGVIDNTKILSEENPKFVEAGKTFQPFAQQTMAEAQQKAQAAATDEEKQQIMMDANQVVEAKKQELIQGVLDQADKAAEEVGKAKGLSVVVDKRNVLDGGVDVTDQVMHKLNPDSTK